MKDKIKGFFIEKKELLIFIGVVALVFIAVITVASLAIKNNDKPVSNNPVSTPSTTDTTPSTSTDATQPAVGEVVLKFALPVSGECEKVRTFFDASLPSEELVSAVIDTGSKVITSTGISYAKNDNSVFSVLSIYDGEVIAIEEDELTGSSVTIKHSDDVVSIYSSLSDVKVSVGDTIKQGTTIANASTSIDDVAAGVHVYLQIKINDSYVNPDTIFGKEIEEVSSVK